jgi:uncharacterized RDD family membrane protein YckC
MKPVEELPYTISTPENVPLTFTLAPMGARLLALILDALFLLVCGILLGLLMWFSLPVLLLEENFTLGLVLVLVFIVRNFYFPLSEMYYRGQTFGKRLVKIRVVCRDGGPLTPGILLARNLTKEIELFFPLMFLAQPELLIPGEAGVTRAIGVAWLVILALLPIFNSQRARLGDLIGGTIVIRSPETQLLSDLTEDRGMAAISFTEKQLAIYGIKELQALEDILRVDEQRANLPLLESVCDKIQRKIKWDSDVQVHPERFLQAFYAAQRKRLEQELLFGRRKEEKS